MQFSPNIKENKSITIEQCVQTMYLLKNQAPTTNIPENLELSESQKRFLLCVANKY